jgi:hypothetical protein
VRRRYRGAPAIPLYLARNGGTAARTSLPDLERALVKLVQNNAITFANVASDLPSFPTIAGLPGTRSSAIARPEFNLTGSGAEQSLALGGQVGSWFPRVDVRSDLRITVDQAGAFATKTTFTSLEHVRRRTREGPERLARVPGRCKMAGRAPIGQHLAELRLWTQLPAPVKA